MPPPSIHHGVGGAPRHGLGAHVVGRRVVVRRRLPGLVGPSGGPTLTDVLGVCLAWEQEPGRPGVCVVQPDDGPAVRIALADVVSGKPVPPRPSPRARVAPREAQLRAGALFDDLVIEPLDGSTDVGTDGWVVRRSATHAARRANSVLAFGPSGLPDDVEVERVLATSSRPVVAVLTGSPEHERFTARGWVAESNDGDTVFQLTGVARLVRALRGARPDAPDDVGLVEGPGAHAVTARIDSPGQAHDHPGPDRERASGVAAWDDDWVGFRSIVVDPGQRRRGLALAVMGALAGRAAEQGATTAYLQVLADNDPALALYARLGFVEHHRYRYLVPGPGPGLGPGPGQLTRVGASAPPSPAPAA